MRKACPENLTWFLKNTIQLFLCMVVSGICIIVNMGKWFLKQTPQFGSENDSEQWKEIRRIQKTLLAKVGAY